VRKTQDARHKTQDKDKMQKVGCPSLESEVLSLESSFRILFIGDVVGRPGRFAVGNILPELKEQYIPQLIIANGENLAGGLGLTQETAEELFSYGVHILTTGNHVWDRKEILDYIDWDERILRPANYPQGVPGRGYTVAYWMPDAECWTLEVDEEARERGGEEPSLESSVLSLESLRVAILNLSGRVFMPLLDDPFAAAKDIVPKLHKKANIVVLDFHAEATSEKIAMGWYLDGQVSAVIGTHTHVQTADERILPNHTAYITDVGMTGPMDSIIGIKKDLIIRKFLTQMPVRFEVAKGDVIVSAVIIDVDPVTGQAASIQRLQKIVKR
jgi:calcineurin-like phosphoesterase